MNNIFNMVFKSVMYYCEQVMTSNLCKPPKSLCNNSEYWQEFKEQIQRFLAGSESTDN